jgi:mannose-1-phosphate guanylyltransferase
VSSNGVYPSSDNFWAVIPAGGSGTRLWPLSRTARPKYLLPLTGERSLLQQTADRLEPLTPAQRTLVVCGPAHATSIARQLPLLPEENILIEPQPKGSGPAIGLAAALIARQDPNALMGSFAADHDVVDTQAFESSVRTALTAAQDGWLVTIGLTPTRPETGYGYIERSNEIIATSAAEHAYRALRFVEKPDLLTATEYVASGRFLWNASMFIWSVSSLLEEMKRLMPNLYRALMLISDAWDSPDRDTVVAEVWTSLDDATIDQGIMEQAARVAVVPAEMGWSDVGDWHGLGELLHADGGGNYVRGEVVQIESTRCVIWSDTGRMIALIGQSNTVVVDTPDALLVIDRSRAQDVKHIVAEIRKNLRSELL